MGWQRVRMRLASDGPVGRIATAGVEVEAVPLGADTLVLTCAGEEDAIRALAEAAGPEFSLVSARPRGRVTLAAKTPPDLAATLAAIEALGAVLLPPLRWGADGLRVEALAPDPRKLVDALGAELLGVAPPAAGAGAAGLPEWTQRQAQALATALDLGYYDAPRRATAGDVAAALGVGRSTFEEHLRAAESAAVRALAPLLRVRARAGAASAAEQADAIAVYARFSRALSLYVEMGIRGNEVAKLRLVEEPAGEAKGAHPHLDAVVEHLDERRGRFPALPVARAGTPFQADVYEALRAIPPGETATYAEIAQRIGRPGAARAVGAACAQNPILLLVPCHRVVPSSGGVGEYAGAGGAATKELLLDLERPLSAASRSSRSRARAGARGAAPPTPPPSR